MGIEKWGPQHGRHCGPTSYLHTYIHGESHNLYSFTSAAWCSQATTSEEAMLPACIVGKSLTCTVLSNFAGALAAWSAKALPFETESMDLV